MLLNFEEITGRMISVAREAGNFIQRERETFDHRQVEIKAKNDLVSYVDREAERIIVSGLSVIFPEAGFIAEEGSGVKAAAYNWIIDPLDGTTNFIHGIPCYCVSIALAQEEEVLCAVVLEVSRNECFYTWKGGASYLNSRVITVSSASTFASSLIATGFPVNNFERMEGYKKALEFFIKNTHGVRRIGSAAADLCYLSCGRVDAFFEFNLKPWDVAAGALIAANAGAKISDFTGGNNWLFGREIAAAPRAFFPLFLEQIRKEFAL